MIPINKSKSPLLFRVILIILLSVLVGGILLYVRSNQPKTVDNYSEQTFDETSSDARVLLTPDNIEEYFDNCEESFNTEDPTTTATYRDEEKGITVDLPYNQNWGSDRLRIAPYDENPYYGGGPGETVAFGPMVVFEGCSWVRTHFLHFDPPTSADAVMAGIFEDLNPTKDQVNDFEVVRYVDYGLCQYPTTVVIGEKYNYRFVPLCDDPTEAFSLFDKIIQTMQLID